VAARGRRRECKHFRNREHRREYHHDRTLHTTERGADEEREQIPAPLLLPFDYQTEDALIEEIYPSTAYATANRDNTEWFSARTILAALNADVNRINAKMLASLPGESRTYKSADSITAGVEQHLYSDELLNRIELSAIPPHCLELKVGVPIMLLRNLDPSSGLCNGTRLIVTRLGSRVIEGQLLNGDRKGAVVFLPRIKFNAPDSAGFPFELQRAQFPVRLAMAMTINKSQGQSFAHVGLDLSSPVFTHGQLYVALSRATDPSGVKILLDDSEDGVANRTKNIVFPGVVKVEGQ
jgi:ATP-dependent DNA helicase PIF1